jgi:hypothetical protein
MWGATLSWPPLSAPESALAGALRFIKPFGAMVMGRGFREQYGNGRMADFRCYFLGRDRKVMAVEDIKAATIDRAVTKGILAMVIRNALSFELWRHDICVYVHKSAAKPTAAPPDRHKAAQH